MLGGPKASAGEAEVTGAAVSPAAQMRAMARQAQAESLAYQSVVVAGLQTVGRVLARERQAAEASISLAQGEKLRQMIGTLESVYEALQASLTKQGGKMLDLSADRGPAAAQGQSWWFALTEAVQSLEEGIDWMQSVVSGQPQGGPAHALSTLLTRLFNDHYAALLEEAAQWME